MSTQAFERYAPFIQEYIYRKRWTDLREVQVEACEAILDTDKHVIIASGTASGKTEAAFFPILTQLDQQPSKSIGVVYVSPLKALINDQFERLDELCEDHDIPVWPWHGDISQSVKNKAVETAQGILQITPESLESLLMGRPGEANRLFSDLRFIIIDEIHALMGQDRGLQVSCLIARLERLIGSSPRRIGLSATLNDYEPALLYLTAGSLTSGVAVGIQHHKRRISLSVESFEIPDDNRQAEVAQQQHDEYIYDHCHTEKVLIFANSRRNAEATISSMKRIASQRNDRDIFYVHHGNISGSLRRETELALRDNPGPTVAAATLTLELGIDIGSLDSTIQLGAPYSCSSFVQRLGRSGRRTGRSQMLFVNQYREDFSDNIAALPWVLLCSIAVIQLYLEERWVEPFQQKKKPFSLLVHQTLSVLMTHGELTPAELARHVLLLPPFKDLVAADEYRDLLRYMLQEDYIQRMDNGGLIVGLKGERMTNHYTFYAVFQSEDSYKVMAQEGEIGSLMMLPAVDEVFSLAGRSWKVTSVDEERKVVYVIQTRSSSPPKWFGGGAFIHERIVQRMKKVLQEDTVYSYLQPNAVNLLTKARELVSEFSLLEQIVSGERNIWIAPWTGTKELQTIAQLLLGELKDPLEIITVYSSDFYFEVRTTLGRDDFLKRLSTCLNDLDQSNPDIILPEGKAPILDKYDPMVPDHLLRSAYLHNQVDVPKAVRILQDIVDSELPKE